MRPAVGLGAEGLGFRGEHKRTGIFMTRPSDRQAGRQAGALQKPGPLAGGGGMRLAYPQAINQRVSHGAHG